jgi:GDPmannose 4,6-dehydratase
MWASDKGLRRPTDLAVSRGNPAKAILVPFVKRLPSQRGCANERLGWVAKHKIADIVRLMIEARKDR